MLCIIPTINAISFNGKSPNYSKSCHLHQLIYNHRDWKNRNAQGSNNAFLSSIFEKKHKEYRIGVNINSSNSLGPKPGETILMSLGKKQSKVVLILHNDISICLAPYNQETNLAKPDKKNCQTMRKNVT